MKLLKLIRKKLYQKITSEGNKQKNRIPMLLQSLPGNKTKEETQWAVWLSLYNVGSIPEIRDEKLRPDEIWTFYHRTLHIKHNSS